MTRITIRSASRAGNNSSTIDCDETELNKLLVNNTKKTSEHV